MIQDLQEDLLVITEVGLHLIIVVGVPHLIIGVLQITEGLHLITTALILLMDTGVGILVLLTEGEDLHREEVALHPTEALLTTGLHVPEVVGGVGTDIRQAGRLIARISTQL